MPLRRGLEKVLVALPQELHTLLNRYSLAALSAGWRQTLRHVGNLAAAALSEIAESTWSCLADMLDELALLAADEATLVAALLFDLPPLLTSLHEQPCWPSDQNVILGLIDGQHAASRVWALHAGRDAGRNSEGLRRLLLSIIQDVRVVPILLARQLAQMRAATVWPESEQRALAQLTRDIHAPLANRLGIWQLKWELEDLAFRFLEPVLYRHIANALDERRAEREAYIQQVVARLMQAFADYGMTAQVSGRPKHIYSIWRKMQKKSLAFDQIYDLRAVRIIVQNESACYSALGIVHSMWAPVPSEFDDYIARPKVNQYRSLHTAVIGPQGRTVEIQIRTHEMHAQAELGLAAHWKYKEGAGHSTRGLDRKIAWIRQLLEQGGDNDTTELVGALGSELAEERIYAVTPKGEVVDLPKGSTPLDFAYHIHTMIGHCCRGAKVNDRIVPLTYQLRTGDRVEILTARQAKPRRDWLVSANAFLASSRSRDKVRAWFRKLDSNRNLQAGKDILARELRRLNLSQVDMAPVMEKLHMATLDDLHMQLALGYIRPSQLGRAILESERSLHLSASTHEQDPRSLSAPLDKKQSTFTVDGIGNLLVQLAQCCQPVAGEAIVGYLTRSRGMTVHRPQCDAFRRMASQAPNRVLPVEWGSSRDRYEVSVLVIAIDRRWLLKDLTHTIAQEEASVTAIHSDSLRNLGRIRFTLALKVKDYGQLSSLLAKLEMLPGVLAVQRKGNHPETHH